MTNTITPHPDVPVPAGARSAGSWEPDDLQPYRVIYGAACRITDDKEVCVSTDAIQFADGSIDSDGWIWSPGVAISNEDTDTGIRLNAVEARALAAALLRAADQLDGWEARR